MTTSDERFAALPRAGSLSVCCITAGPLHRVAAILSLYRPHVDEVVCAVNANFSDLELNCLRGVADRVIRVEMVEDFLQEQYRAWLYAQCSSEWIVSTDSDEVPSSAFLSALQRLTAARDVTTYVTTIRWSFPDVGHWLDEYPWEPSWKIVMAKNDPVTLYIKGGVHEGVVPTEPFRFLDLPLYHLDTAINSFESRQQKVNFYDTLSGTQLTEAGTPVSSHYYLPELFAKYPQAIAPAEDVAAMRTVLDAELPNDRLLDRQGSGPEGGAWPPGTVTFDQVLKVWLEHPFAHDAYRATIQVGTRARTPKRGLDQLAPGEVRPLMIKVRNDGEETWLRAGRNNVGLASKWFAGDHPDLTGPPLQEGPRSHFTADVHPGDDFLQPLSVQAPTEPGIYTLLIDLVHEHVRWFNCGMAVCLDVTGEADA